MATNNTDYIPLTETADELFVRVTSMLYTLRDERRLDLGAPLARMLVELGQLDSRALSEIDRAHGVTTERPNGKVKRG